jgi:KDO2-lipid IV(A) lauroyltransferase
MASAIVGAGVPVQISYRPANNPYFDKRVVEARARYGVTSLAPKGAGGAREIIRALARGESVAMLIDQKFNAGVAAPLFGHMAHTSPGPVRLGRRFGGKVTPMAVERLNGARFRVTFYDPIELPHTDDVEADTEIGVRQLNAFLEARIRARPHEWFWTHRRWPKSMYAPASD